MDQSSHTNSDPKKDPAAMVTEGHSRPSLATDWEDSEALLSEEEQMQPSAETEDFSSSGSWPQSSISRSLQRAEALFKTTFNPSLKWLLCSRSRDEEEEEEGGSFVAAHNLVSRSSARLLRLQQGMLSVMPQWQVVGGLQAESPQVCVKDVSTESAVLYQLSCSTLQRHYGALWKLLEQRSKLLLIHEYTRRARSAAAYVSTVNKLLEGKLKKTDLNQNQTQAFWTSFRGPLSQDLRIHLNHWFCLSSKARSDCYLRPILAQQTSLLVEIRQTLDLLSLQALILMEHSVYAVLSGLAQIELQSFPREIMEDILVGTELYNQAVEEQRTQHTLTQWRTLVLQQADCFWLPCHPPNNRVCQPVGFPVKEQLKILAIHHGEMAARQLHHWASEQSCRCYEVHLVCNAHFSCKVHPHPEVPLTKGAQLPCRASTLRACRHEWTWDQLQHTYPLLHSASYTSPHISQHTFPCGHNPDTNLDTLSLENHLPVLAQSSSVQFRREHPIKAQTRISSLSQCQTCISQTALNQTRPSVECLSQTNLVCCSPVCPNLESSKLFQAIVSLSTSDIHPSALPVSGFCQKDQSSVELLFQVLVSSSDVLAPLVPQTPTPEALLPTTESLLTSVMTTITTEPNEKTSLISQGARTDSMTPIRFGTDSAILNNVKTEPTMGQNLEKVLQEWTELKIITRPEPTPRSSGGNDTEPEQEEVEGKEDLPAEQEFLRQPRSVQWLDLGQSLACADLFEQYRSMLWTHCSHALWLWLHLPSTGNTAGSINLWHNHMRFRLMHRLSQASKTDMVPKECQAMLQDSCLHLLCSSANAHWDDVLCNYLGSGLKDKCHPESLQDSITVTSSERNGSMVMTVTMEQFLLLLPPLLASLHYSHLGDSRISGCVSTYTSWETLQRCSVSLALASVQSSTVWVMSKACQFLSSWSLNKFLLITQGDLKVLTVSLERLLQHSETLIMDQDHELHQYPHHHHQVLLRQQIGTLRRAVSELQAFSSLVLRMFSSDCKRMTGKIFEQTMPSDKHWRLNYKTDFPSSPSEYASLAGQTIIGQVLQGVAPLSDDARVQALSVTMTAFMEAWMEHILKQRIKFSIQGALQLKLDFDSIRDLIQSDQYRLSAELHQRLLNLRVFQQVDSAVFCLLQQPQTKPYLQYRGWEPFRRCCPTTSSRVSTDAAIGGSITNLESMEGEILPQSGTSQLTTDIPTMASPPPGEPYLAPSLAPGTAHQEWLDLRVHTTSPRWWLPGLHCLSRSEP
ncbi:uncharacterized protein ccdc142 isoform X2 [Myripristis murdjan]|uniref:uncharacterized protein ccdc142 isoform X2 n=1 Tax=Myripristis murdjan TaxID=586833 RepID=UPI001175E435|nr:coiled-coil domain-containing protein 142 isoform X2 [Myripristis murdjan]